MARYRVLNIILLLLFTLSVSYRTVECCRRCSAVRAYAQMSCEVTRYKQLCVRTLLRSTKKTDLNPQNMARVSLMATLAQARNAEVYMSNWVTKLKRSEDREFLAIKDCLDQTSESMSHISQSIEELGRANHPDSADDFFWHTGNVQSWTSAALTNQYSCLETFPATNKAQSIVVTVHRKVDKVARLTSNSLALINWFVNMHGYSRGKIWH